jgi:hypothetical protein
MISVVRKASVNRIVRRDIRRGDLLVDLFIIIIFFVLGGIIGWWHKGAEKGKEMRERPEDKRNGGAKEEEITEKRKLFFALKQPGRTHSCSLPQTSSNQSSRPAMMNLIALSYSISFSLSLSLYSPYLSPFHFKPLPDPPTSTPFSFFCISFCPSF